VCYFEITFYVVASILHHPRVDYSIDEWITTLSLIFHTKKLCDRLFFDTSTALYATQ